jgi:hypothetical protein
MAKTLQRRHNELGNFIVTYGPWVFAVLGISLKVHGSTSTIMFLESKMKSHGMFPESSCQNSTHRKIRGTSKMFMEALQKDGILIVQLEFDDPSSGYLLQLVQSLKIYDGHGESLEHSSTRGWFWDVKPTSGELVQDHCARSETMPDSPWHTNCSYTSNPPRSFGLHVIQADRCGGGTLSVLHLSKIMRSLSSQAVEALSEPEFRIEVPPEFAMGTDAIFGPLLTRTSQDPAYGKSEIRCRLRTDIVQPLTERPSATLTALKEVLALARDTHRDICLHLTPELLPNGSIVLLDNGRWLHARNEVKDAGRHLRRIRWNARKFWI